MTDDILTFPFAASASRTRPLMGVTVMLVDDSRFASDAVRLLCQRSGARIRRADCLTSARRHLQVYQPTVAIVDIGLPDGSGAALIAELAAARPRVPVILGTSGDDGARDDVMAAGADGFLAKPVESIAQFQALILSLLDDPDRGQPHAPTQDRVTPDPIALRDDLRHAAQVLREGADDARVRYVAQFTGGLARSAGDLSLARAAQSLGQGADPGVVSGLFDALSDSLNEASPV
ncbi:response regulator [Actibacterium ureilyticum]|uniref:response regulator n=1 Tax=Actibacterium ureilyticum TaxID=1590614 RepID=UPI000BAACA90|nr:response regulator [Actibacterium ureilyticum]